MAVPSAAGVAGIWLVAIAISVAASTYKWQSAGEYYSAHNGWRIVLAGLRRGS
jgi:hypothetical protein